MPSHLTPSSHPRYSHLPPTTNNALHKIHRILITNHINTTRLIRIRNPIALLGDLHHLRSERRANELRRRVLFSFLFILVLGVVVAGRELADHLRDGRAVLRVEVGVDFVEEVEGRWIAPLDCEDEGECAETF